MKEVLGEQKKCVSVYYVGRPEAPVNVNTIPLPSITYLKTLENAICGQEEETVAEINKHETEPGRYFCLQRRFNNLSKTHIQTLMK